MNLAQRDRYWSLLIALITTGAAFMIYEIILLRELVIILGGTVFASSAVLTGVMLGLFLGGYWLGATASRSSSPIVIFIFMELAIGATAIYIVPFVRWLQVLDNWLIQFFLAMFCVIPTAILAGGELPVATHLIGQLTEKEKLGDYTGKLYAADTLGAMIGGLAGPLWLMGTIGALKSSWLAGLLNVCSGIVVLLIDPYAKLLSVRIKLWISMFALVILSVLGIGVFCPIQSFDTKLMAMGIVHQAKRMGLSTQFLEVNETFYQRAIIAEHLPFDSRYDSKFSMRRIGRTLYINGIYQVDVLRTPIFYDETVYLALMSHPHPERVLVIGCGDGGLLRAILSDPRVQRLDQVEIDRDIIRLCKKYMPEINQRLGKFVWEDARVHLHIDDGRRFLKKSRELYDMIVCDLPSPMEEATATFYSYEFYRLVKSHLHPGGTFWTESESPRVSDTHFVVARTVASVFGDESTRLVQPFSRTEKSLIRGEVVVVATTEPRHFNQNLQQITRSYALLNPQPKWINPERHRQWLEEGRSHSRWNNYEISTDDKPSVIYLVPKDADLSIVSF